MHNYLYYPCVKNLEGVAIVDWVVFAINAVIPVLIGAVGFLSLTLYFVMKKLPERIPTKEEMMDMGYTVGNALIDAKIEEYPVVKEALDSLSTVPQSADGSVAVGRPSEGLLGKLMWFAENTALGRQLAGKFLGGVTGGGGGESAPSYYGP